MQRTLSRIRELGWHARLHLDPPELIEYADVFAKVRDIPLVIDHMGRLDFSLGLDQPAMRFILDRLKDENWWMMASNGNRMSKMEGGWDDAFRSARPSSRRRPSASSGHRLAACALAQERA